MKKALPKAIILIANSILILAFSAGLLEAAQTYSNPVIPEIGPADPTAIFYEGRFYLYPTGDNRSYHVYTSDDLVNWTKGRRVFSPGGRNVWAPDVFYNRSDGKFYLYYTANWRIGFAVADKPDQTFIDKGIFINGAIDAHMFQDSDSRYYLYFVKRGFEIHVQKMADPLQLTGKSKLIIKPAKPWEARVTEGPWMIKHNNIYYLLYSGYGANTKHYAVGYATASNPMGPFNKYSANPIIKGGNGIYGPGHGSVTKDSAGNLWHVYHQKKGPAVGWDRFICIDPLFFDPNGILHGKATRAKPQSAPIIKAAQKTR
jgi:beta-xylosidase